MTTDLFPRSASDRAQFFAGKRWSGVWKKWRDALPDPFRTYINELEARVYAEQGRTSAANLRATMAERRERDTGLVVERLKRRIAELESVLP